MRSDLTGNVADIITIFVKNSYGGYVYLNPEVITPLYLVVTIVNYVLLSSWIFVWFNQLLVASTVVLVAIAVTNVWSVSILTRNVSTRNNALKQDQPKLYW